MLRKYGLLFVVLLVLAGCLAWLRFGALAVHVQTPSRGMAIDAVYATGQVEPSVMISVAPRIAGYISAIHAQEGQNIRKGQLLIQLESNDLARTVDEQAARAQYAQQQQHRTASLVAQGFYSGAELDRVTAEANATQAALRRAKSLQNFSSLQAAADGVVLRRDAEVGQFVTAGQVLMTLSCCAPLRVNAEVDEEDIPLVKIGQTALLHAPALPAQLIEGTVESITPKGDPVSRSYRVRIALKNASGLRVGMTVEANLIIQQKAHALLLNNQLISQNTVWINQAGRAKLQTLKVGIIGAKQTEVLAGLKDDDQIIWPIPEGIYAGRRLKIAQAAIPQGVQ